MNLSEQFVLRKVEKVENKKRRNRDEEEFLIKREFMSESPVRDQNL